MIYTKRGLNDLSHKLTEIANNIASKHLDYPYCLKSIKSLKETNFDLTNMMNANLYRIYLASKQSSSVFGFCTCWPPYIDKIKRLISDNGNQKNRG